MKIESILKIYKKTNILIDRRDVSLFLELLSKIFKNVYFFSKSKIYIKKILYYKKKKQNKTTIYFIKNKNNKDSYYVYEGNFVSKKKCSCLYFFREKKIFYLNFSIIKRILKLKNRKKKINRNFYDIINNTEDYFLYFCNFIIKNPLFLSNRNIFFFSNLLHLFNKYRIFNVYLFLILFKYESFFIQKI
ncbi:hypothetical protein C9I84_081 [Candidatus Vidania fulgoroideae]|uniref:Uncharacterized protein n=1 Tax=Candidatus Vidania fulgoroideorum TaxID=881286 RepID=A0A346E0H4_9PROT|nr:hypothetical protein C9I84_081 [Candidatus Vidania fulgoroideae]